MMVFSQVTDRVIMVAIGGAAVVLTVALLTGADLAELLTIAVAFGTGAALPSPLKRGG